MRATVKSLLMYLLIVALLTGNLYLISDVKFSAQIVYGIIILAVLYSGESIFWGRRFAPGFIYGIALIGTVFFFEMLSGWIKVEGFDFRFELVLSSFIFQLFVATGEEISFRGYILKNLIAETGIMRGIVVSSFMFSAIHLPSFVYYGLDFSRGGVNFIVVGMLGAIASIIYISQPRAIFSGSISFFVELPAVQCVQFERGAGRDDGNQLHGEGFAERGWFWSRGWSAGVCGGACRTDFAY